MDVKTAVKTLADDQIRLELEVPRQALEEHFDKIALEEMPKIKLPGFRPGKVPLGIIKKQFKDSLYAKALEKLLPQVIETAVKEQKLSVYGPPTLEKIPQFPPSTDLTNVNEPIKFSVTYALPPEVTLANPEKVALHDHTVSPTEEEIENEIDRATLSYASLKDVKDKILRKDFICATVRFADEDFKDYNLTKHHFAYGAKGGNANPAYLNDLEDVILNMQAGNERDVTITFTTLRPPQQQNPPPSNQKPVTTVVHIKIETVRRREPLVWNEKLLQRLSTPTEAAYREIVKKRLITWGQQLITRWHIEKATQQLEQTARFRIPNVVIEQYVEHEWKAYREQLRTVVAQKIKNKGALEEYLPQNPDKQWTAAAKAKAQKAVRTTLIFAEIKKRYPAELPAAEMDQHITRLSEQYGAESKETFRKELIQSGAYQRIKEELEREFTWKEFFKTCHHQPSKAYSLKELDNLQSMPAAP